VLEIHSPQDLYLNSPKLMIYIALYRQGLQLLPDVWQSSALDRV
jgi:hypothetical protein